MTPEVEELQRLAVAAAELVDDLEGQRVREAAEFRAGHALGFAAGRDVGYGAAERDMAHEWRAVAEHVRRIASSPSLAELEARRYPGYTPERLAELRSAARRRFGLLLEGA